MKTKTSNINYRQLLTVVLALCLMVYVCHDSYAVDYHLHVPAPVQFPVCLVPTWRYSKSKGRMSYGGFTADMGWILMISRYALSLDNARMVFPSEWGHGPHGWTDMFIEPYRGPCSRRIEYSNSDRELRQRVKFKDYYTERREYELHPNRGVQSYFGMDSDPVNDLVTMRRLFNYTFRLNPQVTPRVTREVTARMDELDDVPYVGVHIRWGDKIGRGESGDPRESTYIPVSVYSNLIRDFDYRRVFVATDDYRAVEELRSDLGPDYTVYSRTAGSAQGFSINRYFRGERDRLSGTLDLWIDMELMSRGAIFVGNFESNVARMVHLMRRGPSYNVMDTFRGNDQFSCCRNKYQNCFWFCEF